MNNKSTTANTKSSAYEIAMTGIIASLYIVLTWALAPLSFGMGVRISEGLNFLALYNKRHIYGITLGVFIANYFAYGPWDMVIGSLSTLVFLYVSRWIADWAVDNYVDAARIKMNPMIIKYIILTIVFSLSMFTIALMVKFLGADDAFWPLYFSMVVQEALSLVLGGLLIYPISKRINFYK